MKLKTSLQLSIIIPIVFAIAVALLLMWQFRAVIGSELLDTSFLATLALLGIIMAAALYAHTRDILKKITILETWTETILAGKLDYHADIEQSDDEIGRLCKALTKLIYGIAKVNDSMQKQMEEHMLEAEKQKHNAESSQSGMKHLAEALGRFKDSQDELMYKERQQLLKQVVRGVIYDLGDALTPVLGAGSLVSAHPEMLKDQDWTLQQINTMHDGVRRARKSLKNLAGVFHQPQQETQPADLNIAVKSGIALAEQRRKEEHIAEAEPIKIQTVFAKTAIVSGDETDLEEAVAALVLNAMESMPGGGIISVSTKVKGPSAALLVQDSGRGMSAEVQNRCLDPFYSTKERSGVGMGLTMVASTAYRLKGSLKIESEEGDGTRVFVNLPLWKERTAEETLDLSKIHDRQLRILVVDDDPWAREAIQALLGAIGHKAEAVGNGPRALEELKTEKFDLVFVDWAMPVMSGDRLAAAIKKDLPHMPIVMLTAFGHAMIAEDRIPAAVDVMLLKPVAMEDLEKAIAQAGAKVAAEITNQKDKAPQDWDWSQAPRD